MKQKMKSRKKETVTIMVVLFVTFQAFWLPTIDDWGQEGEGRLLVTSRGQHSLTSPAPVTKSVTDCK